MTRTDHVETLIGNLKENYCFGSLVIVKG